MGERKNIMLGECAVVALYAALQLLFVPNSKLTILFLHIGPLVKKNKTNKNTLIIQSLSTIGLNKISKYVWQIFWPI